VVYKQFLITIALEEPKFAPEELKKKCVEQDKLYDLLKGFNQRTKHLLISRAVKRQIKKDYRDLLLCAILKKEQEQRLDGLADELKKAVNIKLFYPKQQLAEFYLFGKDASAGKAGELLSALEQKCSRYNCSIKNLTYKINLEQSISQEVYSELRKIVEDNAAWLEQGGKDFIYNERVHIADAKAYFIFGRKHLEGHIHGPFINYFTGDAFAYVELNVWAGQISLQANNKYNHTNKNIPINNMVNAIEKARAKVEALFRCDCT